MAEPPELAKPLEAARAHPAQHAAALVCFLILIGLGSWQVQRLQWKTGLIAQIAASVSAPPRPLSEVLQAGDADKADYTHVLLDCPGLTTTPIVRLYAVTDEGPARRAITFCPLASGPYRSVLVDRGFLKGGETSAPASPAPVGPIVGLLQKPEKPSPLAPVHTQAGQDWYSRDIAGMAKALNAPHPAPLMLLLERPAPEGGDPRPSASPKTLSNNHLGYALTWYGLAAALAGVYIAFLRRPSR